MGEPKSAGAKLLSRLLAIVWFPYLLGLMLAVPYFNWTYARDHGFVRWLFLGEFVATAKAVGWPYFAYRAATAEPPITSGELPRGVQNFFFAMDALVRANETASQGSGPEALRPTVALLREAIDSSIAVDRADLNATYAGLGDHFLDDAMAAAAMYVEAFELGSRDKFMSGAAAWIRWTNWWNMNANGAMASMVDRYNLDVR